MLTITSLLSILFMTFRLTSDTLHARVGTPEAGGSTLVMVPILVVWLYGTLVLAERRSGYVIMLIGSLFALGMPVIHVMGAGGVFRGAIAQSSGAFLFVWTLHALGVTGMFSFILSCADCGACNGASPSSLEQRGIGDRSAPCSINSVFRAGEMSMSTAVTERIAEASPRFKARLAGVFYLLTVLSRMFVEIFVRNRLVVSDDAAATATNILAHEPLWRWGFAGDIISFASYIALTAVLYELFRPVNRSVSLVAAFFSLAASVVQAISSLFHLAPLVLLGGAPSLKAFTAKQLQALALVFLRLRAAACHNIGLVFFGVYLLLAGILILKSTFLPRILGVLMVLAGLGYLPFMSPPLVRSLPPYILIFPGVGQISLTLWLLAVGVNEQRWKEQAAAGA